jgi:stage III sporulation protein AE
MMILNGNKKIRVGLAAAALLFMVFTPVCYCVEEGDATDTGRTTDINAGIIERQIKTGGADTIKDELLEFAGDESVELLEGFNPDELIANLTKGDIGFNPKGFANNVLKYFFREIYLNIGILIKLSVLVVVCASPSSTQ